MRVLTTGAGAALLAPVVSTVSVVAIDARQARQNARIAASYPPSRGNSQSLVVYFSRSGNTELMALEIAKVRGAQAIRLNAQTYPVGFYGWVNALRDAGNIEADILPSTLDITPYETIYVGSPIWLYSPAPPIWEFIRRNDLTGKRVVLFNSLNSRFEQARIDEFADCVRQMGGTFAGHIYVIRGRMTRQLETEAFLKTVRESLEASL